MHVHGPTFILVHVYAYSVEARGRRKFVRYGTYVVKPTKVITFIRILVGILTLRSIIPPSTSFSERGWLVSA